MEWKPIKDAPKDGRMLWLCWMDDGVPTDVSVMRWGHIARNVLIPDVIGMWTAVDGSFTWCDAVDGGPEFYADVVTDEETILRTAMANAMVKSVRHKPELFTDTVAHDVDH